MSIINYLVLGDASAVKTTELAENFNPKQETSLPDLQVMPTVSSVIQTRAFLPLADVGPTIQPTTVTTTGDDVLVTKIKDDLVGDGADYDDDLEQSHEDFDGAEITEQPKKRFDTFVQKDNESEKESESLEEERQSAELSFKERLKQRFKQFRQEHKGVLNKKVAVTTQPANNFGRSFKTKDEKEGKAKERPKFSKRTEIIRKKLAEVLKHSQRTVETSTLERTFVPSFLRTKTVSDTSRIQPTIARSLFNIGPSSTRTPVVFQRTNRFNRPEIRKNLLHRVLGKASGDKTADKEPEFIETDDTPEVENDGSVVPDKSIQPSNSNTNTILNSQVPAAPLFHASTTDSGPNTDIQSSMHENRNTEEKLLPTPLIQIVEPDIELITSVNQEFTTATTNNNGLESTLEVATVVPKDQIETYLEIATIRSPYTFDIENNQKSTRYITVTRTYTSDILLTPSVLHQEEDKAVVHTQPTISPEKVENLESTLHISTLFPEDIKSSYIEVATIRSPYSFVVEDDIQSTRFITVTRSFTSDFTNLESTKIETPLVLNFVNLERPAETITETLTSEEVIVKTSVLPVIVDEDFTSLQTLTQSFTVTSLVTAVKTLAASRPSSNFAPSASFIDIDREFDNEESITRETFLPIELGFANQNQLDNEKISSEKSVSFFDLEPSFVPSPSIAETPQRSTLESTSSIPTPPLSTLTDSTAAAPLLENLLSSEQLEYIKLLQQRLSGIKPQVRLVVGVRNI